MDLVTTMAVALACILGLVFTWAAIRLIKSAPSYNYRRTDGVIQELAIVRNDDGDAVRAHGCYSYSVGDKHFSEIPFDIQSAPFTQKSFECLGKGAKIHVYYDRTCPSRSTVCRGIPREVILLFLSSLFFLVLVIAILTVRGMGFDLDTDGPESIL